MTFSILGYNDLSFNFSRDFSKDLSNIEITLLTLRLVILNMLDSEKIKEQLERYIETVRPKPSIRHQIDLGYELDGRNVYLVEIRPVWDNPDIILRMQYAKATYVVKYDHWKVYWSNSSNKWLQFKIKPTVKTLKQFLKLVDDDDYAVFKG